MDATTAANDVSGCKSVGAGKFKGSGDGNYDPEGDVSQAVCPDERASVDGLGDCPIWWRGCPAGTNVDLSVIPL